MLRDVKQPAFATTSSTSGKPVDNEATNSDPSPAQEPKVVWPGGGFDYDPGIAESLLNGDLPSLDAFPGQQPTSSSIFPEDAPGGSGAFSGELFGLGQFEALPPFEMIEEL